MTTSSRTHIPHPAAAALGFEQTVPPINVNRRSPGEVFVTDSARVGEDQFVIAMRVPRGHQLWSDQTEPWHDTISTVEAFRQAFVLVRYKYLRFPTGTPSAVQSMRLRVLDLDAYRDDGASPLDGVVQVRLSRTGAREDVYEIDGTYTVGGSLAATLSFTSILFPRSSYDEIRAFQQSRRAAARTGAEGMGVAGIAVEPLSVGRRDPRNVVVARIGDRPDVFPIVVDRTHPSFFDRDYDHVPGSLLIEALRQGTLLSAAELDLLPRRRAAITGVDLNLATFVELDAPALCTIAARGGPAPASVSATVAVDQHGAHAAAGTVELTAYP